MRIISGKFKKQKLLLPDPKITRPLRDYVKESLFNLLSHSPILNFKFKKSVILDVFSGSGSFGIECISRGASHATFVENNKNSFSILKKNIEDLGLADKSKLILNDFLKIDLKVFLPDSPGLVFLDPPFESKLLQEIFEKIIKNKKHLSKSIIIVHHEENKKFNFNNHLDEIFKKKYGRSIIFFGKIKN